MNIVIKNKTAKTVLLFQFVVCVHPHLVFPKAKSTSDAHAKAAHKLQQRFYDSLIG